MQCTTGTDCSVVVQEDADGTVSGALVQDEGSALVVHWYKSGALHRWYRLQCAGTGGGSALVVHRYKSGTDCSTGTGRGRWYSEQQWYMPVLV